MTSGTRGVVNPAGNLIGFGDGRTWSGGDGKYVTFAGTQKIKWNHYTCSATTYDRSSLRFGYIREMDSQNPPNGGRKRFQEYYPIQVGNFPSSYLWTPNDQLKLLEKLLKKVKSHDFNLAVNLGQLHQTVDLLSSNLRKLGLAALYLKRGQFGNAARQLGVKPRGTRLKTSDISGRWLEMQYGWLPLIGDSFEAAKAFEAISNGPRTQFFRVSHRKFGTDNECNTPTYFGLPNDWVRKVYIQYECTEEVGFARQLGLLDPASVAWELLPWSFVVDWFIPIGSYLDVLNQVPLLKGRFLTTEVYKRESNGFPEVLNAFFQYIENSTPYHEKIIAITEAPKYKDKRTVMTRTYSEDLGVPFPSMHLGGAVQGKRLWNAISLAQQRFGRSFRY